MPECQQQSSNRPYLEVSREQYGCVNARVIRIHFGGENVRMDIYSGDKYSSACGKKDEDLPINFMKTSDINELARRLGEILGIEARLLE